MKTFGSYLKEEEVQAANVRSGTVDIRDPGVRAQINAALAAVTDEGVSNPYVALQEIAKVLSRFHIYIPNQSFLEDNYGVATWPVNQFGFKVGMDDKAAFIEAGDSGYTVYFEYQLNDKGSFTIFCEVIDEEELDDILKDLEEEDGPEMDDLAEENLQELSKDTLKSYIRQAADDKTNLMAARMATQNKWMMSGTKRIDSKMNNRDAGIEKALNKLEETEQLQELSKGKLRKYIDRSMDDWHHQDMTSKYANTDKERSIGKLKKTNRAKGISRAIDKEEGKNLQELSRGKLADYVSAASTDMANRLKKSHQELSYATTRHNRGDKPETVKAHADVADKEYKKASKRQRGIYKAVRKLAETKT